jgi:hypothetical protein
MVQAKEMRVSDILKAPGQLHVPLYQRRYEWRRPEWEALFDDVERLALDRIDDPHEGHFLGPVVVHQTGRATAIVDGQQRLLTLSVLMCALRDAEPSPSAALRRRLEACLLSPAKPGRKASARLKVLPTDADMRAFLMIVDREEPLQDHQLTRAYEYFGKRLAALRSFDTGEAGASAATMARAVLAGLQCVRIETRAGDSVNRIYETLNNRGKPLTQGDLLRNYVFMRLGDDGAAFHEHTWAPLDERFTGDALTHIFWLDLVRTQPKITQRQTYAEQYKRLQQIPSADGLKKVIKSVAKRAELYELIDEPALEKHPGVRRHLQRLHDWKTTTVHPMVMFLLELRDDGRCSDSELVKSLRYLESYFVRRMVIGRATDNMNRVLLDGRNAIEKELRRKVNTPRPDQALREYLSGDGKHWASNEELRVAVSQRPFYNFGKAHQKALVLTWIEESLSGGETAPAKGLSVEHVMPQTLNAAWKAELRPGLKPGENVHTIHDHLRHTLGNLTLATPASNSAMSNAAFAAKKEQLKKRGTGLKLTAEITKKHYWRPADIRARSDLMVDRIIRIWPGPLPKSGGP